MTISAQMQEMLFSDDRNLKTLKEICGIDHRMLSKVRSGEIRCSSDVAARYVADFGWEWKIRAHNFRGDPAEALAAYLKANKPARQRLTEKKIVAADTLRAIMSGSASTTLATIDKISTALGLVWITVEKQEAVA